MPHLTKPLLDAIIAALNAALAGDGFSGGDFDGQNPEHFRRALNWAYDEQARRARARAVGRGKTGAEEP